MARVPFRFPLMNYKPLKLHSTHDLKAPPDYSAFMVWVPLGLQRTHDQ
jgi:hypothetical protein